MKRIYTILLALLLLLCLCACDTDATPSAKEYTFPENTVIAGVDMTKLTREEAWAKLEETAASYVLNLNVDGNEVTVSAKDMGLSCSKEDFMAAVDAMEAGTEANTTRVIRFQDAKLRLALNRSLNRPYQDAALVYDEAAGEYVMLPHAEGLKTDHSALAVALKDTIRSLTPQQTMTGFSEVVMPFRADSEDAQLALEKINKMIHVELSYVFGAESSSPITHTIPADLIRSFVTTGEDGFTPSVDEAAVAAYAEELASTYSTQAHLGAFLTTNGEVLDMVLPFEGCTVDSTFLTHDLVMCIANGISAERTAYYIGNGNPDLPYGGTYVEVDLDTQHLWYYKDGDCLVDTDLVSGCVALNMQTPNGNFYIYSRSNGTYLEGPGYKTWVRYWMPFTGGYGLHDAQWRDEFGGDIYLDDGSHGCVNLPLEAAGTLFNNSTWGTRVILYGGEGHEELRPQEILGETLRMVSADTESVKLKMRSRYAWPDFFYESDNPEVATVDAEGTVTIHSIGIANITVIAASEGRYKAAKTTVTIHVTCAEDAHELAAPVITKESTCCSGVQTTACTKCSYTEEVILEPAYEHNFVNGECTTCGEDE